MKRAVYPGSFDPPTYGHLDVIKRAAAILDEVMVAVADNPDKQSLFTVSERLAMLKELVRDLANVSVDSFSGLTVDYVRTLGCNVLIRGIRTVSDFEYEFQMALTNRSLAPEVETVFVMSSQEYAFLSSRLIKEAAGLGGNVSSFVPPLVEAKLKEKLGSASET